MIMDVGCGDGGLLPKLARYGHVNGVESDERTLCDEGPFRDHIFTKPLGHASYRQMRFDVMTALDVIGRMRDDWQAVIDMTAMLKVGGHLVVTAPARILPWSGDDEGGGDVYRYTAMGLRGLLEPHGRIVELRHIFHSQWLPQLVGGGSESWPADDGEAKGTKRGAVNQVLTCASIIEHRITQWLPLPFGTWLLAVIEKPVEAPLAESGYAPAVPAA